MKDLPYLNTRCPGHLLAAFLCFFAIMPGCNCKKPAQSAPVDTQVQKYFNYQPGSYWIYRDSITGQVDSFVVASNDLARTAINGRMSDNIYMRLESYSGGQRDNISLDIGLYTNNINYIFYEPSSTPVAIAFSYPYSNLGSLSCLDNLRRVITLSENETVDNHAYDSVAHITQYDEPLTYKIEYDVCNTAGIIKMSIDHDSTRRKFELLRYQLVR